MKSRNILGHLGYWLGRFDEPAQASGHFTDQSIVKALFAVCRMGIPEAPCLKASVFEETPSRPFADSADRYGTPAQLERWAMSSEALLAAILGTAYSTPHFGGGPHCDVVVASLESPSFNGSIFHVRWELGLVVDGTIAEHLALIRQEGRRFRVADVAIAAFAELARIEKENGKADPRVELERLGRALKEISKR